MCIRDRPTDEEVGPVNGVGDVRVAHIQARGQVLQPPSDSQDGSDVEKSQEAEKQTEQADGPPQDAQFLGLGVAREVITFEKAIQQIALQARCLLYTSRCV